MTIGMLSTCLAVAVTALVLLVLTSRALLRNVRGRGSTAGVLLTAAGVVIVALLWIDIVILWCLVEYSLFAVDFSGEGLNTLIDHAGSWGPIVSIGLMVAHSLVPFPAEVIAVANGIAFGPWLGVFTTWTGAMLGAILSYEVTRAVSPTARARLIPSRYHARLDAFALHVGIAPLLIARLLPVMSFNLVNYAAGLTGVSRWRFIWTTGVGILPLTVLSVLLGSQALHLPAYFWILAGLAVLLFLVITLFVRHRISNPRYIPESPASRRSDSAL